MAHKAKLLHTTWAITLVTLLAPRCEAGQGVISVNQHRIAEDTGCIFPRPNCLNNEHLPFQGLEGSDNEVDLFALHVNPYVPGESHEPLKGRFCQAVCDSTYANRPKIISSDWSGVFNSDALTWLQKICIDAGAKKGRLHFEHFEPSLNTPANAGECIYGYSTWLEKARTMLSNFSAQGSDCGDSLDPNGTLQRGNDAHPQGELDLLFWRTPGSSPPDDLEKVTLTGFGFMGAVAMGDRLDMLAYLRGLRSPFFNGSYHKGANLTRVWASEQWTAQAPDEYGGCHTPYQSAGPVPFEGELQPNGYDLGQMNSRFFRHLREFVQAASDRGIVVQYTLFDKHGLLWKGPACPRQWPSSPYNWENNNSPENYLSPAYPDPPCTNCNGEGPVEGPAEEELCPPHPDFVNAGIGLAEDHHLLIARSAQEIGGVGNVMFEIINEAIGGIDWPGANQGWQILIAAALRMELPVNVARDAFNDEPSERYLNLKSPDAGGSAWNAYNARVIRSQDADTGIWMGSVKPNTASNVRYMRGSLPIGGGASRTALSVRANVSRMGNSMELGVSSTSDATSAGLVRLEVGPPVTLGTCSRVAIVKQLGGAPVELASTCIAFSDGDDLRLYLDLETARASVFSNSWATPELQEIPIGTLPTGLSHAYFRGSKSSGPYIRGDGEVDNFEADVYCTNSGAPYNCVP